MCGGTTVINESHGDWMRVMADYSWPVDLERASDPRPTSCLYQILQLFVLVLVSWCHFSSCVH